MNDLLNLARYCQYIRNTGQRPLEIADFDEDHEPVGPMMRKRLLDAGLIEEWQGALMLTDAGEALL